MDRSFFVGDAAGRPAAPPGSVPHAPAGGEGTGHRLLPSQKREQLPSPRRRESSSPRSYRCPDLAEHAELRDWTLFNLITVIHFFFSFTHISLGRMLQANRALSPLHLPGHAPATPTGPPVEDTGGGDGLDGEEKESGVAPGLCLCPSWAHGPLCRYLLGLGLGSASEPAHKFGQVALFALLVRLTALAPSHWQQGAPISAAWAIGRPAAAREQTDVANMEQKQDGDEGGKAHTTDARTRQVCLAEINDRALGGEHRNRLIWWRRRANECGPPAWKLPAADWSRLRRHPLGSEEGTTNAGRLPAQTRH